MELQCDTPFYAGEQVTPAGGDWSAFFDQLPREPAFAVVSSGPVVDGYATAPCELAGLFVEPVESVVGLRPFNDAVEGTVRLDGVADPVPYVFYEVEKAARMMLHQSGLALEILTSPAWLRDDLSEAEEPCRVPRQLAGWAVTEEILAHYRESTGPVVEQLVEGRGPSEMELGRTIRRLLTGLALGQGRVVRSVDEGWAHLSIEPIDEPYANREPEWLAERVERLAERLRGLDTRLPDRREPDGYDALNDWLVATRLNGTTRATEAM